MIKNFLYTTFFFLLYIELTSSSNIFFLENFSEFLINYNYLENCLKISRFFNFKKKTKLIII